jgi:hypothetical protein
MGRNKGQYNVEFPVGPWVRVADRQALEKFMSEWKWHHPLEPSQLQFAGQHAQVESASFYHGGDELYQLKGIPGIWHEACLEIEDASLETQSDGLIENQNAPR